MTKLLTDIRVVRTNGGKLVAYFEDEIEMAVKTHVLLGAVATREIAIDDQYFKKFKYNMEYSLNKLDNYDLLIHCRLREEFNQDMTRKYVLESAMYGQLIPKLGKE